LLVSTEGKNYSNYHLYKEMMFKITRLFRRIAPDGRNVAQQGFWLGLSLSFVLILCGMLLSGKILSFLDFSAVLIVVGGTFGATLVNFSLADMRYAYRALKSNLSAVREEPIARIATMVQLAQLVKRNGLVALDREAAGTADAYLRLALELAADGKSQEDIRRILETENKMASLRAKRAIQVFETLGSYAPAMGLIGTLIGLIQMLGNLNNPTTVAPAMAVALVATFYGALLANIVCLPIAGKLRVQIEEDNVLKAITIEGVLSLRREENPMIVEQRLQSYLPIAIGA